MRISDWSSDVCSSDLLSGGKSMGTRARPAEGGNTLAEMREFAGFSASTQRYIRRSLDISLHRRDALEFWSRDGVEAASIRTQTRMYDRLVFKNGRAACRERVGQVV